MFNLTDRAVVLGITGSIAAYKGVDLASKLTQAAARVDVVMSPEAARFVSPITFKGVTGRNVFSDMWDASTGPAEPHIALARGADVMVIAPATATVIARLALGLAEEMVSLTALATRAPMVVCPAMDSNMYTHEAIQGHVETLRRRGVHLVGPEEGRLASGEVGLGRFSEVEKIIGGIRYVLGRDGDLAGKKIVVSAGGTHEPIDPVRFVGNRSSGKMGFALAEAARDRGAEAVLVTGPVALPDPYGVTVVRVEQARQMRDAIVQQTADSDALIMAAAVADYQAAEPLGQKLKRENTDGITLSLVRTPDILAEVQSRPGFVKVGFAAESHDLRENAKAKLKAKGLDIIAANDIMATDAGFAADTNRVVLFDRDGGEEELPLMSKYDVACRILDRVFEMITGRDR
ncbi:MAG TPA: bifunctional phosphopantothenoylcysteine decarboxylase/phosphopantothenate--cysteine ligase CoaBC [Dehalococcoidia bacterium]|nr:bifunctional phosphopantothenoylcysteine decarboxylase/phosphopantothenate--cysteine ligase CoaBC [Dehalococcoidia bacterium]